MPPPDASPPAPTPTSFRLRIDADAALDGTGMVTQPASMLVHVDQSAEVLDGTPAGRVTLLALDHPQRMDNNAQAKGAYFVDRKGCVLIPGLVNAHTHLDLTHIGAQPFNPREGFTSFIKVVLSKRLADPEQIAKSVRKGLDHSYRGGVVAVGDIGGVADSQPSLTPLSTLRESPMNGVSFLEFFAIGPNEAANLARLEKALGWGASQNSSLAGGGGGCVRLGISPHAPYTVSLRGYQRAEELASKFGDRSGPLPLCTHLAETPEERDFIASATGPFRDFLEKIGAWDSMVASSLGKGATPAQYMLERLIGTRYLLAHVHQLSSPDLRALAGTKCAVAYCPRAGSYFGAPGHFGAHRYNDMQVANICVALGTDSVINLPPSASHPTEGRLSTLDEARLLFQRDGADPRHLLAMCTIHGARALGMRIGPFTFPTSGEWGTAGGQEIAGVVSVPAPGKENPYVRLMACDTPPDLLVLGRAPFESL